jgi:hypothetical protein
LWGIAGAVEELGDATKANQLRIQARKVGFARMDDDRLKFFVEDVRAAMKVGDSEKLAMSVEQMVKFMDENQEQPPGLRAFTLQAFAKMVMDEATPKTRELVTQVLKVVERINEPLERATALLVVAKAAAQLNEWRFAMKTTELNTLPEGKVWGLFAILQVWEGRTLLGAAD